MKELNKCFSISDVVIDRNAEDKDFAIMELWALGSENNSHHNPISREVLERDAHTFKGKFIVGQYNKFNRDVKGHETEESIFGYVSVTDEPQFKTKIVDGVEKEFVVVQAYISKIYAKEIVDMFKIDNKRSVSCEFSCALEYDEDQYGRPLDEMGNPMECDNPILGYSISGITILGKVINPSVRGADAIMKRFAEDTNKLVNTPSKEDNMEENKEFSEVEQPKDEDIIMQEAEQIGEQETEQVLADNSTEEMQCDNVEMAQETVEEEPKEETADEMSEPQVEEMSCKEESEQPTEQPKEEEKSISEQAKEFAEDDYKDFVEKLFSEELNVMVSQIIELKKFMENRIKSDTEKRFSEIMVEPKLCLGEKAYNVLFEEGSKLQLGELDEFEVKVKAFCEDAPKKQEKSEDELMKFAYDDTSNNINTELSVEELIKKYN